MKNVILSFIIIFFIAYFSKAQKVDKLILHFAFNKSDITEITRHQLDSLLESNRSKYRIVGIELYAHCDSVGNHHYNDSLSTQRAIAVKNYLATNGINEAVFKKVSGLGKRQPLNHNATEEERFLNRR